MGAGSFNQPAQGYPPPPPPGPAYGAQPQIRGNSGMAVASLVLGILSVLLFVIWASMLFGPLAIVFGVLGRNEARREGKAGMGLGTAGMTLGIVGMLLTLVFAAIGFATT